MHTRPIKSATQCYNDWHTSSGHSKKSTNLRLHSSPITLSQPSRLSSLRGKPSMTNFCVALADMACRRWDIDSHTVMYNPVPGSCCLQYTCDSKLGGGLGKGNQHLASDNSGWVCWWHLPDEVNGDLDWDNSPLLNVALNELSIRRPTVSLSSQQVSCWQMDKTIFLRGVERREGGRKEGWNTSFLQATFSLAAYMIKSTSTAR